MVLTLSVPWPAASCRDVGSDIDDVGIVALAAEHGVFASAAVENVVADVAFEDVVAAVAGESADLAGDFDR